MQTDNFNQPDDHEAKMARADLYKLANYSMKLFKMINEGDQLEGWVQAKITKAADYIASVYHFIEYEMQNSDYGDHLESVEMYSESVRRAFEQKLMEAKACRAKKVKEGSEDRLAAAREKAAAKGKIKDKEETPKSNVRKVAGKSYGGSKQKSDEKVDEGFEDKLAAAREKAAAKGKTKEKEEAPKSNVRKVSGKAYGGSKQKSDEKDVDESVNKSDVPAYKRKASGAKDWKVSQADLDKEANNPKHISSKAGLAKRKKELGMDDITESRVTEGSAHGWNVVRAYEKTGGDQLKITRWLRKEAGLPKDAPVYFDDADLVYGDKTIVPKALVNPKLKMVDLLNAVIRATGGDEFVDFERTYRPQSVAKNLNPARSPKDAIAAMDQQQESATGDYSAKKGAAGRDLGKPGKNFEKIAKSAGERYGSKERGEKVAGAVLKKLRAK